MLEGFNDDARIWIFQADRELNVTEITKIENALSSFLLNWNAHGTVLSAAFEVRNAFHLIIALDESKAGASGCSIDSLTREVKELGSQLGIDFFNRMLVVYKVGGAFKINHHLNVPREAGVFYFDNTLQRLGDLRISWERPLGDGWLKG
jgi:hypothetical protein